MGIQLVISIAYHPQTNSQSERTIQPLEVMLQVWVFEFNKSWDTQFPLIEFSYNNGYRTSIKITPFEALDGRKCRSLANTLTGPKTIRETIEGWPNPKLAAGPSLAPPSLRAS